MRSDAPLFSEAELLDVLTGIDGSPDKSDAQTTESRDHVGPSVNVVLDGDVFASERAFAEFMESLASDDDGRATNASDEQPPAASKRVREAATEVEKPRPKRKRRKHELDHLRAVAAELERKLRALNHASGRDKPGTGFWRHISNQMMAERQKAVGENARLRQLIKEQVKSVKAMHKALEKTPDLSEMGIAPACDSPTPYQPTSKELYRDLFKNISSSYSDGVGKLLQNASMPAPSVLGNRKINMEMDMVGDCGPQMCLQFMESRFVPFRLTLIGDHAWDFLSGSNGHEDFQLALERHGNEMFGHATMNNATGPVQLLGNIAVRRYSEPNKLTLVWECDGESQEAGVAFMRVHQKGCCVFEPSEEDPENATIFRACARMTPSLLDSGSSVGATTEAVIHNYEKTVVYLFEAVLSSLAKQEENKSA